MSKPNHVTTFSAHFKRRPHFGRKSGVTAKINMALNVRSRLPIVVGLSWKKLGSDGEDTDESVCLTSPITRSKSRQSPETITEEVVMEENEHAEKEAMKENMFMRRLTRTRSVREAFGTLRQVDPIINLMFLIYF